METRLPKLPCSSSCRILTGHMVRSTLLAVEYCWARRYFPSPPAMTVSTTSLTVPPNLARIARISAKGKSAQTNCRVDDKVLLNGVIGMGWARLGSVCMKASRACEDSWRACTVCDGRNHWALSVQLRMVSASRSLMASCSWLATSGRGCGCHGWGGDAGGEACGERSCVTVIRSTPDTPSTMAWWTFQIMGVVPSGRPRKIIILHRGWLRSSGGA